ncbi:MAG: GWxTD domain-containing protein [Ignavibacteria bacterium]|nr:GWxTD domain-containing protein [Ignavibacteria bacterium]
MKVFVVFVALLVVFKFASICQDNFEQHYYNDYRKLFTLQPIYIPTEGSDSLDIFLTYRFSLNHLTFEKNRGDFVDALTAVAMVELIVRDTFGLIRKTITRLDTFKTNLIDQDFKSIEFAANFFFFRMPSKKLSLELNLFDKGRVKIVSRKVEVNPTIFDGIVIGSPIYSSKLDEDLKFSLSLSTNQLDFTKKNKTILIPIRAENPLGKLHFKIKSVDEKTRNMTWKKNVSYEGTAKFVSSRYFTLNVVSDQVMLNFTEEDFSAGSSKVNTYIIEIPENIAYLQNYQMELFVESPKVEVAKYNFRIFWENLPLTLRNVRYAIDLMHYIVTDDVFNDLLDKKEEDLWSAFFDVWKKFDVDTTTIFNEAMEEFYSRADFAYFNFKTIDEKDGAKTSRGKIYILYGKPSFVDRKVEKDGRIEEVWVYYRLKQKFIFVFRESKYILDKIVDL